MRTAGGDAHQRALTAAVAAVLTRIDAHAARNGAPGEPARPVAGSDAVTALDADAVTALDALCACFGLTPFERDTLVLAAAAEIDPSAGARCEAASGRPYPTFSLALAALDDPHWSALTPVAPLRRWRLVTLDDEDAPTTSRVRVDERVLHFLAGVPYLDTRLHGLVTRVTPPDSSPAPSHAAAARAVAARWTEGEGAPHAELVGADRQTRWEVAAAAARAAGLTLYAARAEDLPGDPADRDALARLWEREAVLVPAALLVEAGDTASWPAAEAFLARVAVPLVVSSPDPLPVSRLPRERVTVPALTAEEQRRLWAESLNGAVPERELAELVAQFSLPAHVIRAAGTAVRRAARPGADVARLAWAAGLAEARVALDELGRRVEPRAGWDDLVLPETQRAILREIVAHVRQRATVYAEWGFEAVLRRGLGVTALFAGGSGTGKTLAAEVIAGELGLDLFVIDLSQVVSKYIGETEKNLRRVFDAAERGGALLLFDEADALFGKRSEVKDSHDRYANLEVSYLLMRMESYRGLAILTTNMKKALDPAFLRRIRFVVEFPFPGTRERAEIWRRVVPPGVPAEGLDVDRLAQLAVAGGSIRNIALSAAFLAADEGSPLRMRHLLAAARTEYLKHERSLTPAEVDGWV
ncbi:ATPase AAA [Carbonactinospora thermoautotrophica]|uniref:ATPase AAA n=2 Tax=Carbonactinospora thermoautotrophica TaxID=1469144 RepID=A0A132N156_9ACTN|nr:AAA family ATPase [Carbonactinospora thermoautotrophica]KWX03332.1 ATPase AAA [Carbonactinospora thermoautotrophica]